MPTGLDVIGTCFDKEVIANIASAFYQYLCDENIKDLALETDKEKCLLSVTLAKQYIDAIFSIDPLKVAADAMSHIDIHTLKLSFLSGNIEMTEESSVTRVGISSFLNNEKYFNSFVKLYNLSKEQQTELILFLEKPNSDVNSIPDFIMNEDRLRDLGVFMNASLLEMEIEKSAKKSISNQQFIKMWKASKYAVECFPQEYQLWDASTKNKADQVLLLGQRTPMDKQDKDEIFYASALSAFLCYYTLYDDNKGKSLIFENDVKEICKDPMRTAKFIEFLKNYEYGSLFCSEYAKYVEETGITPMFALDAIEPKPLVLTVDNNKEHKDWFLAVDNKLFKDNNNATKYESLLKLYSCLVEKGWIDADTPKALFIYRLSGLGTPVDLSNDLAIKRICPYKKIKELADHLYYREERPPYRTFLKFFGEQTNLSSHRAKTEDSEEVKSIFKECNLNWHPVER